MDVLNLRHAAQSSGSETSRFLDRLVTELEQELGEQREKVEETAKGAAERAEAAVAKAGAEVSEEVRRKLAGVIQDVQRIGGDREKALERRLEALEISLRAYIDGALAAARRELTEEIASAARGASDAVMAQINSRGGA